MYNKILLQIPSIIIPTFVVKRISIKRTVQLQSDQHQCPVSQGLSYTAALLAMNHYHH